MGHPKQQRKKYSKPMHPWQKARIDQEKLLKKEFGLKNKKEIWRTDSLLKRFKTQAKKLIIADTIQSKKEEELFRKKLSKYDLLPSSFKLEDVLSLQTRDILNLRLQTQTFKQGFSRTVSQARQFIVHGHILVNNKKIDIPSYLVLKSDKISYSPKSLISKSDHPERPKEKIIVKTQLKLEKKKEEPKEEPKKEIKKKKVPTAAELAEKKKALKKLDKLAKKKETKK